jgi:hypothetical protein
VNQQGPSIYQRVLRDNSRLLDLVRRFGGRVVEIPEGGSKQESKSKTLRIVDPP